MSLHKHSDEIQCDGSLIHRLRNSVGEIITLRGIVPIWNIFTLTAPEPPSIMCLLISASAHREQYDKIDYIRLNDVLALDESGSNETCFIQVLYNGEVITCEVGADNVIFSD